MRNLTMRWTAVACCALSACLLAPAAARAQGSPPPAPVEDDAAGDNARAAQLYRDGNLAFDQKRWAEAELLYLKAWALVRTFDIATNLGHVQLKLNKPRSAAAFLAFALRTAPPSVKPEQRARMRGFLEEAKAQVGTVRLQGTDAADAEVFVDGERVPAEEVKHEIYVEPGEHRIVIRRAGYEETAIRVVAAAGVRETMPVAMKPLEVKAAEGKAPEASEAGPAKLPEAPIVAPIRSAEAHASGPRKVVLIGGAATAGAAAVAGVVFTVLANANASDAGERRDALAGTNAAPCPRTGGPPACVKLREAYEARVHFTNAALFSFVGAGAIGVGSLVYGLVTRPSSRPQERVQFAPLIGASNVGLSVSGTL